MRATPTRDDAWALLTEYTDNPSLIKHALGVEAAQVLESAHQAATCSAVSSESSRRGRRDTITELGSWRLRLPDGSSLRARPR